MLRNYNVNLPNDQIYEFMQTLDKDKNGFIEFSVSFFLRLSTYALGTPWQVQDRV